MVPLEIELNLRDPRLYCKSYILINPAINVFTCHVSCAHEIRAQTVSSTN